MSKNALTNTLALLVRSSDSAKGLLDFSLTVSAATMTTPDTRDAGRTSCEKVVYNNCSRDDDDARAVVDARAVARAEVGIEEAR